MPNPIWFMHFLFWWPFLFRGQMQRMRNEGAHLGEPVQRHNASTALIVGHSGGIGVMYFGVGGGLGQSGGEVERVNLIAGSVLILLACLLARWVLQTFTSWRLRAELTPDHKLSTDGPFRWVRHPIYAAMNVLALGTVAWVPNTMTVAGFVIVALFGDLRGRAEEGLLLTAFGDQYRAYCARVKRFIPYVY